MKSSESVEVYYFARLSGSDLNDAMELVNSTSEQIQKIEASYAVDTGYVQDKDIPDIMAEIETYLEEESNKGMILNYTVGVDYAYIKFLSGLTLCYEPELEGFFSGENDPDLTVSFYQPISEGTYISDAKDYISDDYSSFENMYLGSSYMGRDVSLKLVEELPRDQIIVWYGHGGYTPETGCYVITECPYQDDYPEYAYDMIHDFVICSNSGYSSFTYRFVREHCENLSNDLIMLSCCHGLEDNRLGLAFLEEGASAVLGFSDSVIESYAQEVMEGVLLHLAYASPDTGKHYTLSEALTHVKRNIRKITTQPG